LRLAVAIEEGLFFIIMDYLIVKNQKIGIHLLPQVGSSGREFRMIGTAKNLEMPEKWSNQKKSMSNHYIYTFKYLDNNEFFEMEFDYNDNFVKKLSPTFMSGR
jgi:hypothetical protein